MRAIDIIERKKRGEELSAEEIRFFVAGYVAGDIPDYQAAALLMAIWIRGMSPRETTDLTLAMAASGDQVDLSAIAGVVVDKHSTGGVADTTTLVAGPVVAACGGRVAKMSGRGLGHTGGTLDKLESIPGFSVNRSMKELADTVGRCGISVIGQTADLVPADKLLYALRDVTATVDNTALIASSIMSKKLAAGADAIVLDVKTGGGAFMKELDQAEELARVMVEIGRRSGKRTVALVTDMSQPLGNAVGNALEVREALDILAGRCDDGDLRKVSVELAAEMLVLAGVSADLASGRRRCAAAIADGSALEAFRCMVEAQGGDARVVDHPDRLPAASRTVAVTANAAGYLGKLDTEEIGRCALLLGAGREKKEDRVDPAVGIWMRKRIGDAVESGESLAELHVNDERNVAEVERRMSAAASVSAQRREPPPLVHARVGGEQV